MSPDASPHRRKGYLALTTILVTVAATVLALPALALDSGVFELDGNAQTLHGGGLPDDWDRVCHQVKNADCSTSDNTTGAIAVAFGSQGPNNGFTFTGGGSKDPLAIEGWAWNQASGGLPGKDILLDGFAARYSTPGNSTLCPGSSSTVPCNELFFGMDRFDNAGDAQNGFWFLQNALSTTGGVKSGGGTSFTCAGVSPCHKNGDLLVVSDFSIGGSISTISVYIWNTACTAAGKPTASCADSNLQLLQTSNSANCTTSGPSAAFCGIVNGSNGTVAPWSFTDKKGNITFDQGEFYEGGIDLSSFPGLASECFATTLAESRSSTSTSAVLKSFVLATFGSCSSSITTTSSPTGSVSIGTGLVSPVSDSATVTVGGAATWSGSVQFSLCGPNAGNCATGGTAIGSPIGINQSTVQPVVSANTSVSSVGSYCWRGDFTSATSGVPNATDNGSNLNECFTVGPVTPTLTTQASGPIQLGGTIHDTATLSGTASQPGSPIIGGGAGAAAGGTISFTVFGPNNCTTVAGSSSASVSGDGSYGSGDFTPGAVGTYTFVASYSGSSPNTNGVGPTACPDATGTETVLVNATTQIGTTQNWLPNDSATVSSPQNAPFTGTITFTLYNGAGCTGSVLYSEPTAQTVSNGSPTAVTHNSTFTVSASTTVYWGVVFTSNTPNVGSSSSCVEQTSLTITGNS